MGRFIVHEPIASGLFNITYNGSVAQFATWDCELQNSEEVLDLLVSRLVGDWTSLNPKFRKCWTSKDIAAWRHERAHLFHVAFRD